MTFLKHIPIGRKEYFLNLVLGNVLIFLGKVPSFIVLLIDDQNKYLAEWVLIIGMLGALILASIIIYNSILNRARDVEGTLDISVIKWLMLTLIPIVAIYGQGVLLFKKGKFYGKN